MSPSKLRLEERDLIENLLRVGMRPAHINRETGVNVHVICRIRDQIGVKPVVVDPLGKTLRAGYKTGDLGFLKEASVEFLNWLMDRHRKKLSFGDMIAAEMLAIYKEEIEWKKNPPMFERSKSGPVKSEEPLRFKSRRRLKS